LSSQQFCIFHKRLTVHLFGQGLKVMKEEALMEDLRLFQSCSREESCNGEDALNSLQEMCGCLDALEFELTLLV
jgi:hypothetical protein